MVVSENFKSYLAGLIEGDGSFIIPSVARSSKNRKRYAKIKVAFVKKDKPLAECLQSFYGGYFEKQKNYIVWIISAKEEILQIAQHINGYLRTPKINDFYKMIDFMIENLDNSIKFSKLPLDNSSIHSNSWLAGFVDADGSFNISITARSNNRKRIQIAFRLECKEFYSKNASHDSIEFSEFTYICHKIATTFQLGFYKRTRQFKHHSILIVSTSLITNGNIVDYFEKFPLFSSKYLDYLNWKKIYKMQVENTHLTELGLKTCEEIKKNHNSTRTTFTWTHLNNLFIQ